MSGLDGPDEPSAEVPVVWVDAFCDGPFSGNPAAVCLLAGPAPGEAMQALASELGLSETAFVWPDCGDFSLRWFTPSTEVDLCGHATVAAAHALVCAGAVRGRDVRFKTRSGPVAALVDGDEVSIDLPADQPRPCDPPDALARCWPIVRAARGRLDLLLELSDAEAVRAVDAATPGIEDVPHRGVIVTARAPGSPAGASAPGRDPDYVLRFFGPRVGVAEDPVTGSAQCLLGPYWGARLGRSELRAAQLSHRGGTLAVRVEGERVQVAGRALTVISGQVRGDAARQLLGRRR